MTDQPIALSLLSLFGSVLLSWLAWQVRSGGKDYTQHGPTPSPEQTEPFSKKKSDLKSETSAKESPQNHYGGESEISPNSFERNIPESSHHPISHGVGLTARGTNKGQK